MAYTGINSEDRLVQKTFAEHLCDLLLPRQMSGEMAVWARDDEILLLSQTFTGARR